MKKLPILSILLILLGIVELIISVALKNTSVPLISGIVMELVLIAQGIHTLIKARTA